MKRAVGIIRVSSLSQKTNTSLDFQKEQIVLYSKMNGLTLVDVISDVCSGGLPTREGIEKVKKMVLDGKVEVVLTSKADRIFRSMLGFSKFFSFLKEYDIELVSCSEGLSNKNKTGELVFNLMMSVGSYEKNMIRERVVSGKVSKVKSGTRAFGGRLPFGYTNSKEDGSIILEPTESKVVSYIFKKSNQLSKNKKLTPYKRTQRLLKLLKIRGFKYRDGKDFKSYHLKVFLNNEFYFGKMTYGDLVVSHNHPKIISKRLFNQLH